jgi:DNA-binding transcriptional regulator LsrR (DeoR family)
MAKMDRQAPEKYRILGKLASQGMGAEEIASILGISRVEAGQLLSLSNMAKSGG